MDFTNSEIERLEALRSLDVLDTPREAEFDDLVMLASRICGAPVSLVSFVDEDRQWFKAKTGFDKDQTDLNSSICSRVMYDDGVIEIEDTWLDERTSQNPLCIGEGSMRFYAGAPLVTADGHPVGTLCVLDEKPRVLDEMQRDTLRVLARQAMKELELRKALREQQVLRKEMDHRLKNSLQSVSSVMRLYARQITDPVATEAIDAIQRRLQAISALHTEMQVSSSDKFMSLDSYLDRIVGHLRLSVPANVTIELSSEPVEFGADKAASLGVIVSEAIANSVKHGFPDDRAGVIYVRLSRQADGGLQLECRDDGVGNAVRVKDESGVSGLGRSLLEAAASQLDGTLESSLDENGSSLVLTFPV